MCIFVGLHHMASLLASYSRVLVLHRSAPCSTRFGAIDHLDAPNSRACASQPPPASCRNKPRVNAGNNETKIAVMEVPKSWGLRVQTVVFSSVMKCQLSALSCVVLNSWIANVRSVTSSSHWITSQKQQQQRKTRPTDPELCSTTHELM